MSDIWPWRTAPSRVGRRLTSTRWAADYSGPSLSLTHHRKSNTMAQTSPKGPVGRALRRVATQVKEARKNLYYRVRETPRGNALLQAAEFIRSPLDNRERRAAAQEYLA